MSFYHIHNQINRHWKPQRASSCKSDPSCRGSWVIEWLSLIPFTYVKWMSTLLLRVVCWSFETITVYFILPRHKEASPHSPPLHSIISSTFQLMVNNHWGHRQKGDKRMKPRVALGTKFRLGLTSEREQAGGNFPLRWAMKNLTKTYINKI